MKNAFKNPPRVVSDQNLIRREIYNPNNFSITLRRDTSKDQYVVLSGITLGNLEYRLEADSWIVLPHGYFIIFTETGDDLFDLITNYGNAIGKGNKLPSLPVFE